MPPLLPRFLAPSWMVLAVALWSPAWGESGDSLEVMTSPVSATAVYLKSSNEPAYRRVGDHTPVTLHVLPGTCDVLVEAADGPFSIFRGERTGINPRFDHPTIVMHREVNWAAIAGLLAAATAAMALATWRIVARARRPTSTFAPLAPPAEAGTLLQPGAILTCSGDRRFVVGDQIGRGGMGQVFAAAGVPDDGQEYAVKILHTSLGPESLQRFEREVSICARLHHSGIVQVIDWGLLEGPDGERPFMVMERAYGHTLRHLLSGDHALGTKLGWSVEMLRAVRAAHRAGIVHRDLKPENVMIGASGRVKIMDFGIAHHQDQHTLTHTGQSLGTPAYMSPEHMEARDTKPASDVYSLGVVFYEMFTGEVPHEADSPWLLLAAKMLAPPLRLQERCPDLPPELDRIVLRMLEISPAHRYQSCDEVLADVIPLAQSLGDPPTESPGG